MGFWTGRRVLITSGPTREPLDPIRFLTNASSGRMGWALAQEASARGARATVISGPVGRPPRLSSAVRVVPVTTALEMLSEALRRCASADVVVGAAAVSDWRLLRASGHKIKRSSRPLHLTLVPNPDIIKAVAARRGRRRRPQVIAGFALETRGRLASARRKLKEKGLDLVVANGPASLGAGRIDATLVLRDGRAVRLPRQSKRSLARAVFDHAQRILAQARAA